MTAYGIPAPRRLSLPRVKFKRPRWPKGNPLNLLAAVGNLIAAVFNAVVFAITGNSACLVFIIVCPLLAALNAWAWWASRDDDGPSAT